MVRKMILVGVLIFVPRGSTLQIGLGLLTCMFALGIHIYVRPYIDVSTDVFQSIALVVLSLTLFAGMLLKSAETDDGQSEFQSDALAALLILINASVLVFAVGLIAMKLFEYGRNANRFRVEAMEHHLGKGKEKKKTETDGDSDDEGDDSDDDELDPTDLFYSSALVESGKAFVNNLGYIEMVQETPEESESENDDLDDGSASAKFRPASSDSEGSEGSVESTATQE
jgi:hypothetical protein